MVSMSDTYQKAYKLGSVYYEIGTNKPYTGVLYGTYDNGKLMTTQDYVDGIGNGKWTQYDPYGNKECEGTYIDNRVEGPVYIFSMKTEVSNQKDNTLTGNNLLENGLTTINRVKLFIPWYIPNKKNRKR